MHRQPILTLSAALLTLLPMAAQRDIEPRDAAAERIEGALKLFSKKSPREQRSILATMRSDIAEISDDYLASIRALANEAKARTNKKLKTRQKKQKTSGTGSPWQSQTFPIRFEYAFGFQQTRPITNATTRKQSKSRREAAQRRAELAAMLLGHPPDLDLALATLLREFDHDRSADPLSQLFETWRNGDESFYHALDRTAGTDDSLFFYDAMLDDFIKRCVPKKQADYKKLRRSLNATHDALHRSFLAYRQYRAFREAAALALLLPPDAKLPQRLVRYEQAPSGMFSVRQQVALLLQASNQDLRAVARAITGSAKPLPSPLWSSSYAPVPAFNALVQGQKFQADSDVVLRRQTEHRATLSRKIASVARDTFVAELGAKTD